MKYFKGKILVGVTGGIGSGKTLVCRLLEESGFKVYYADHIAKELYLKDKNLLTKLVKSISKEILNFQGKIILSKLREFIFSNKKNYLLVNSIVHPVVIKYLNKEIKKSKEKVVIVEAALIFESKFDKMLDYVIAVYTDKKTRIQRLMARDGTKKSEIERISKFQMDEKKKIKKSDFVIVNNSSREELTDRVELIVKVLNTFQ